MLTMRMALPWLMLLAGCAPTPPMAVSGAAKPSPVVSLKYSNISRYSVSMSILAAVRMSGYNVIGKREELQPGPAKTVAEGTINDLLAMARPSGAGLSELPETLVLKLEAREGDDTPTLKQAAFVLERDWLASSPSNMVLKVDDSVAQLTLGSRVIRQNWQPSF